MLIKNQANVNIVGAMGWTPLHEAAKYGKNIYYIIWSRNISIGIYIFTNLGQVEFVEILIKHGANINLVDKYGHTALHTASIFGNYGTGQ